MKIWTYGVKTDLFPFRAKRPPYNREREVLLLNNITPVLNNDFWPPFERGKIDIKKKNKRKLNNNSNGLNRRW